uniref:Uncharacterized protein n=1 Tax=Oryza meridionalis TaxID=40149 RepID=A0A0E0ED10_9ORYZ
MAYGKGEQRVATTQGKCWGIFICWLLGNGCLFGFNSMLTIEDYYTFLFPNYHPTRVVTLTYQPFVLGTTAIFTYHEAKVNTRLSNLAGYTLFFLSSFAAIILDVATSGRGGIAPFVGVCIIAAAFGVADGHVQGGMTGDLSLMCPEFIQSFFAGLAASGMITSALRLITKAAFENSRDGLRKGATENTGSHSLGSWYCPLTFLLDFGSIIDRYALVLIASYNVWDLIGRYIPLIEQVKLRSRKVILITVVSRFLLIPAFYYTAKYSDQGWMIKLTSFLGLSNGYLTVCILTEAPKGYKGPEQNALGNLLVLSLLGGIFCGAILDWLWLIVYGSLDENKLQPQLEQSLLLKILTCKCIEMGDAEIADKTTVHLGYLLKAQVNFIMSLEVAGAGAPQAQGKFLGILVCWVLGNGSLFAWNSMLTIEDYYSILFPTYHPTRVLTIAYQPFAFGITCILTYHEAKLNTRKRNLIGFALFLISSFALIMLDIGTKGRGGLGPFIGVCIISALFGTADASVQGGLVGDLSFMCPEFIQSFLAGLAASGVLTSALRLITKAAFENSQNGLRNGAILFFSITCFFELVCLLLYAYVFPKLPIVKYYRSKAAAEGSKTVASDLAAAGINNEQSIQAEEDPKKCDRLSTKELLIQNIDYAFDIFLIYVLTLSIFPGFLSEDTGAHSLGTWYALTLIAMYNVWDLIGRYLPLIKCIKLTSRKGLTGAILARFLFIPAFYFTAKYGDQGYMIFLTSFLGLTNGFLTGPEQNALGNVLVVCLLGGIFSGVVLDWLWLIGKGW